MPAACTQNLLNPDGSCLLWTLYNEGFKPVMCTARFRKQKHCEDIFIPSFCVEAVERYWREQERQRKYRELVEDMETLNKGMMLIMKWRECLETHRGEILDEYKKLLEGEKVF